MNKLKNLFFSHKFISYYIVIGVISLLFELSIRKIFLFFFDKNYFFDFLSFVFGLSLAFYLNIKYNFKLRKSFIIKSLIYFSLISLVSWFTQFYIKTIILNINLQINLFNYETLRLLISGFFFIIFYFFHLNISFKNRKKIGIAVYTNYENNIISNIYKTVDTIPDFIHIDLVDKSFNKYADTNNIDSINFIKKLWPKKSLDLHIMSDEPSLYIKKLKKGDINKIYFHQNIKENIDDVINLSKSVCDKIGLAIFYNSNLNQIKNINYNFDEFLVLCIDQPGTSGSRFQNYSFEKINELQSLYKNANICVDGGINKEIADKLDCEYIVSSSFIIKSTDPKESIYKLRHELFV